MSSRELSGEVQDADSFDFGFVCNHWYRGKNIPFVYTWQGNDRFHDSNTSILRYNVS